MIVNTACKCFHIKLKRSQTSVPLILCKVRRKKARTYFKSDWTCFKPNNSVSPIGHRSSQIGIFIKKLIVLVRSVVMVRKVELNATDRVPQIASDAGTNVSICLPRARDVDQTYRRSCSRPIADRYRSYGNQALLLPYNGNSF